LPKDLIAARSRNARYKRTAKGIYDIANEINAPTHSAAEIQFRALML
jgi:hypothetical protein